MSTFKGLFDEKELRHIAADYFEPSVHHCEAFFFSHAHTDHMCGLNATFGQHLKDNPNKKIYCSLITKEFFSKLDKYSSGFDLDSLVVLDIGVSHLLTVHDQYMTVTLIPAGHCPGSVMFLFEVNDVCVLFTGDFRYDANDISKFKQLKNSDGSLKKINNIYLDTTFAYEEYKNFPSRKQSLQAILTEINKWLRESKDNVVNLELPARFAYEFVFGSIHERLKIKVHVPTVKLDLYQNITEIFQTVTDDSRSQVHSCPSHASCVRDQGRNTLTIRLCTMLFKESFVEYCGGGVYKNCDASEIKIFYATHSSLNELRTFVKYLSPLKVTPFVIQPGTGVNLEILTERVLKSPGTIIENSQPYNSMLESPVKKKARVEFHEETLNLKSGSGWTLASSSVLVQKDHTSVLKSNNSNRKLLSLNIESPPSSPDS